LLAVILMLLLLPLGPLLVAWAVVIRAWRGLQQGGNANHHNAHGGDQRFWQFHRMFPQASTAKKGGRPVADFPLFLPD
jgi:hypothetical protein